MLESNLITFTTEAMLSLDSVCVFVCLQDCKINNCRDLHLTFTIGGYFLLHTLIIIFGMFHYQFWIHGLLKGLL